MKRKQSRNQIDPLKLDEDDHQTKLFRINSFVEEPRVESPVKIKMRRAI
jgi:hypothetical protein